MLSVSRDLHLGSVFTEPTCLTQRTIINGCDSGTHVTSKLFLFFDKILFLLTVGFVTVATVDVAAPVGSYPKVSS